ncbi:unnamed protein product [Rangifer tarandus platyrhynchus]|uniref:Uncharacterized protein n=1 Tax=Rangifer tarandus platyrhynchus TaxID=3082113 RepID=A0AC59ZMN5_RANTA
MSKQPKFTAKQGQADTGNGSSGQVTSGSAVAAASPRPLPEPPTVEASLPPTYLPRGHGEETDTDRAESSSRSVKEGRGSQPSERTRTPPAGPDSGFLGEAGNLKPVSGFLPLASLRPGRCPPQTCLLGADLVCAERCAEPSE